MRALWLVNQLWIIVPVNPRKNRASSELLFKSTRQVSMGCRLTRFTNSSRVLPLTSRVVYQLLYNNQINSRALFGQSAVGYCAGKPTEKSRVFWIIEDPDLDNREFRW